MQTPSPQDRTLAEGRYTLHRVLGVGGCAAVYEATDTALGVRRAVKVLTLQGQARSSSRRRLRAEARAMARLNHPNVLRVYDIGKDGQVDFVVMELAEAGTLQDLVDKGGPLPAADAARYLVQVLSALSAAHERGVVHRDVKPQNILLTADGRALLADFGIALIADEAGMRRTQTNVAMGSMAFMPPEQRLDARSVGPAADLYAVGTTLYAVLTAGNPVDLFAAKEDSPRWEGVPPQLKPIIRRAVQADPEARYPSARELALDLLAVLEDSARGGRAGASPAVHSVFTHEEVSRVPLEGLADTHKSIVDATRQAVDLILEGEIVERDASATLVAPDLFDDHHDDDDDDDFVPVAFPGLPPVVHRPTAEWRAAGVRSDNTRRALFFGGSGLIAVAVALAWMLWRSDGPAGSVAGSEVGVSGQVGVDVVSAPAAAEPAPEQQPRPPAGRAPEVVAPAAAAVDEPAAAAPPRRATGTAGSSPVDGAWKVSVLGRPGRLVLRGPTSGLSGTLTMRNGQRSSETDVRGRYDAGTGVLFFEEVGVERPAEFEVSVVDQRGSGTMRRQDGSQQGLFTLRRE